MSHLPPPRAGRCRTEIWLSEKGVALHGGVAATVAGVALHCATKCLRSADAFVPRFVLQTCHLNKTALSPKNRPFVSSQAFLREPSVREAIGASLFKAQLRRQVFPKDPAVLKILRRINSQSPYEFTICGDLLCIFPRKTRCFRDPAVLFYYRRIFSHHRSELI